MSFSSVSMVIKTNAKLAIANSLPNLAGQLLRNYCTFD
jgi:hypothetical protein